MYEYFENENKTHEIFRVNIISYMLNCHAEGRIIHNSAMRKFTTAPDKYLYKTQQLNRIALYLIQCRLIIRVQLGIYAVIDAIGLKKDLQNALMFAGLLKEESESSHDMLLDIIDPDKPSRRTFRINVLRHMINLHIQQLPIKASGFNQFSAHKKEWGVYNGVHIIFKKLLVFCAIKRGAKSVTCHGSCHVYQVTDLEFIKKMLCDLELEKGFPVSYPGMMRKMAVMEKAVIPAQTKKAKSRPKEEKISAWHKPAPAWVNMLDSVFGNLKGPS